MGYRVLRTSDAWVRLIWPHDQIHGKAIVTLLQSLGRVPGVRTEANYVDLPCTVWNLPDVHKLWQMLGCVAPKSLVPVLEPELGRAYGYQLDAARKILGVRGLLLADQMGLGKTTSAIVAAKAIQRASDGRPIVIISTLSSRNVWRRELIAMSARGRFHALATRDVDTWDAGASCYFVHFDIVLAWMSKLQGIKPCCVIVDEAHHAKNGRTQRGRGVFAVTTPAARKILLTGTPIENRPSDLVHLLTALTGTGTWGGWIDFRIRYCGATFDGHHYQDGEPTHVAELQARMEPYYLRRTADMVALELPPQHRQRLDVVLSDALQAEHDEVLSATDVAALVLALQQGAVKDRVLETLTRLRHLTSVGKISATVDFVKNAQAQDEGVVVFTWEKDVARRIARAIPLAFCLTGDDPQHVREQTIDNFQATPGAVLVATLGALKESVTLHAARITVLHDWSWKLSDMLQAEGRVWRNGQLRACQCIWVMATNSIDELIAKALYRKGLAMQSASLEMGTQALEELGIGEMLRTSDASRVGTMLEAWL